MGWLYGWHTREALVEHLRDEVRPNHDLLAERSTHYARHLWMALRPHRGGPPFVMLFLLARSGDGRGGDVLWGYKDMDESCGPVVVDCPLDLLAETPEPVGEDQGAIWAREWRARVRANAARRVAKFSAGDRVSVEGWIGSEYRVVGRRGRRWEIERDGRRFVAPPERMRPLVEEVERT